MSYLVSVDVVPDRREEEQREYEAELIESGQAARGEECGEIFEDIHNAITNENLIPSEYMKLQPPKVKLFKYMELILNIY